jgi:DNA-3-methyladenine glycosylase
MNLVTRSFYARDTVKVAQDLLGKILVRNIDGNMITGIITETEAYKYKDDAASHSFRGMTERNKAMFGEVGRAYVYFTYGMHYCVNAVARSSDYPAGAVLIRSLFPQDGIDFMLKQQKSMDISNLTNGPAKLTQALKITKKEYGEDLTKRYNLFVMDGIKIKRSEIKAGPRIGIKKATTNLWNFKISKNILEDN